MSRRKTRSKEKLLYRRFFPHVLHGVKHFPKEIFTSGEDLRFPALTSSIRRFPPERTQLFSHSSLFIIRDTRCPLLSQGMAPSCLTPYSAGRCLWEKNEIRNFDSTLWLLSEWERKFLSLLICRSCFLH